MCHELSEYELKRLRNIEENKKVLLSLGLLAPPPLVKTRPLFQKATGQKKRKRPSSLGPQKALILDTNNNGPQKTVRRRSLRILGVAAENNGDVLDNLVEEDTEYKPSSTPKSKETFFGAIPDVPVGTHWEMRLECSRDGVHRPTVAGIHGNAEEGCYSIALSGGYEDDVDMGDRFTYTGEGGRDLKGTKAKPKNLRTAAQSKDQTLTRGNLALSRNVENRRPVRVIRGYKLANDYAPEFGYRYDGLYTVEKWWEAVGLSGYLVFKFAFKRCPDQAPPPWEVLEYEDTKESDKEEEREQ